MAQHNTRHLDLYHPQQGGYREYGAQGGASQGGYGYRGQQYGYRMDTPIAETECNVSTPYSGTYNGSNDGDTIHSDNHPIVTPRPAPATRKVRVYFSKSSRT